MALAQAAPCIRRVNQLHDPNNAQGLYPPDALLFVANLSTQRSIEQLQEACEGVFGSYCPCHTKVKHDKNGHPYAFVQFHNINDAHVAVEGSKDLSLSGRKIRIEFAKAERAVILSRIDGYAISMNEAMKALEVYGAIEACKPSSLGWQTI
ncbi:hypothetical protein PV10_01473 [Exophiala mesophila]|uniref:RRM domain-containing protein n=1 Tax=Exophiala mesophila TaxID=212818 RepID=A0A0D1X7D1_EXOME|nr:uncharacterized protein PV10_01473 [Exophiala mesophila]KIV97765.1 hypothetical protein PV10_01473 [Exophiala mesophila]